MPQALMLFDEAYAQLDQPAERLNCLAEAGQIIERTQERYNEPELHRLRGDLLNTTGDQAAAEQSYHQAVEVAKRLRTIHWERWGRGLARLWPHTAPHACALPFLAVLAFGWSTAR